MDKQDLQVGESWWQNSYSTTRFSSKKQNENETEIWIEKDGFKIRIRQNSRPKNIKNLG